jgi:hypothetical protein
MEQHGATKWKCLTCGILVYGWKECHSMSRRACVGPCAMRAASSHALVHYASSNVTACLRCGAWATKRPRMLLRQCPGVAPTYATRQARKRIRLGVHPIGKLVSRCRASETPSNLRDAQIGHRSWSNCLKVRRASEARAQVNGAGCGNARNRRESQIRARLAAAVGSESSHKRQCVIRTDKSRGVVRSSDLCQLKAGRASSSRPLSMPLGTAHSDIKKRSKLACASCDVIAPAVSSREDTIGNMASSQVQAAGTPAQASRKRVLPAAVNDPSAAEGPRRKRTWAHARSTSDGQHADASSRAIAPCRAEVTQPCFGGMESVRKCGDGKCGCGMATALACKRCSTPVCLACAKSKREHKVSAAA